MSSSSSWSPRGIKSRYRLLGLVAQGQFGRVYCAVHRASGQLVALKAIDRQRSTTSQFLRELSFLVGLGHPHLTGLQAIEYTQEGRYLVLDYAAGGTLRQLMEAETPPRLGVLLRCLLDIVNGLAYAHDRGIVHCDVKPENILLDLTPRGWRASLTDFGIARSDRQEVDVALEQGGSPAYMAPERFAGQAYPASDLYGVGIILYEMLLGDRPFQGRPSELRQAHLHQAIAWPERLAPGWRRLLAQVLAKDARQRLGCARTLATALERQLDLQEAELGGQPRARPISSVASQGFFPPPAAVTALVWPAVQPQDCGVETRAIALRPAASLGGEGLWRVQRSQLLAQPWTAAVPGQPRPIASAAVMQPPISLRFPAPLTQVVGSPRGGFATTATGLYCWSEPMDQSADQSVVQPAELPVDRPKVESPPPDRPGAPDCWLAGEHPLGLLALAPDGSWGAVLQRSPDCPRLILFRQFGLGIAGDRPQCPVGAPQLRQLDCGPGGAPEALVILDRRHGVALVQPGTEPGTQPSGLALFSRRGHWLARFSLPVAIRHCVRGQHPYELWAIEAQQPRTLLRIQLRPFRLERLPLAIPGTADAATVPQQILPQSWGCLLANAAGHIWVVDRSGQGLGQLQVPLQGDQQLQDILAVGDRGLAVSLVDPQGLSLYQLDWAALALPLIF